MSKSMMKVGCGGMGCGCLLMIIGVVGPLLFVLVGALVTGGSKIEMKSTTPTTIKKTP